MTMLHCADCGGEHEVGVDPNSSLLVRKNPCPEDRQLFSKADRALIGLHDISPCDQCQCDARDCLCGKIAGKLLAHKAVREPKQYAPCPTCDQQDEQGRCHCFAHDWNS